MAAAALPWIAGGAAGLGALSNLSSASNASKQSKVNAKLLDQQAKTVALHTGSQVGQIRSQGAQVAGQQAAAFADNGTGTGGSNALIQRSSAIDTELDAANANYNGLLQAADISNQASAMRATAKAQRPGLLSLLGGAANTAGAYYSTKSMMK
ncbi:hypothetical protein [Klebsiella quasipneumoniae]|uniref:hypothetical protein n=1 Tax=Klebsiella quasipneumoniae TaxID=1463165 RepID=UPI002ABA45A2|nr:hypothetical protein [Klebsiella quasipneumoniae]MDZ2011116.1 hypothetical protein [Klebsiella quasipneumoniae]